MSKPKKPTMNQVKTAINNLIYQINEMYRYIKSVDSALAEYIKFNKDTDKFIEYMKEIAKKEKETQNERRDTKDGGRAETHQKSGV